MIGHGRNPLVGAPLAWGTIGWAEDGGSYYELGDETNHGVTLVNVTLNRGRDSSKSLDASVAQGQELLCQLDDGFFRLPPRGARCIVAIPEPYGMVPGGSTIVRVVDPRGRQIYGDVQPGDAIAGAYVGQARAALKQDGSATLATNAGNAASGGLVAVTVKPDGSVELGDSPTDFVPLASVLDSFIDVFLTTWTPVPHDGGAALKTALGTWASSLPFATTASSKVKCVR